MRKYLYEYYRISLDDENAIESNSITNQRHLVKSHISTISELADMPTKELVEMETLSLRQCGYAPTSALCRENSYIKAYDSIYWKAEAFFYSREPLLDCIPLVHIKLKCCTKVVLFYEPRRAFFRQAGCIA